MNKRLDGLLADALTPDVRPSQALNEQILRNVKEEVQMREKRWNTRRAAAAAAIAAGVLVLGGGTTYAAWRYLSPQEAAHELSNGTLADAFEGKDAVIVNEAQTYGDYRVTFIGIVSGRSLTDFETRSGGEVLDDRSYWLMAIEHADGTPMADASADGYESFLASPFVQGLDPRMYNIYSFSGGYSEFVKDGVRYRMGECDNLELFADREVYLGLTDDDSTRSIELGYIVDEATGKITRNEAYEGTNALFKLPLDPAKADPAKAQAYVDSLFDSSGEDDEDLKDLPESQRKEIEEGKKEMEKAGAFIESLTAENIDKLCTKVPGTEQEIQVDPDSDWVEYRTANSESSGGMQMDLFQEIFPDNTPKIHVDGYGLSEGDDAETVQITVLRMYEDGRITIAEYTAKNR